MNRFSSYILASSLFLMAGMAVSCNDDDFDLSRPQIGDDAVRIGATVEQAATTRGGYIASGDVTSGNFLLTYPYYYSGVDAFGHFRFLYHYGDVTFGYKGEEKTGFVNVGTPTAPKYLVWSPTNTSTSSDDGIIVYPSGKASPIVMDNFMYKPVINTTNNPADTVISLKPADIAGKFDNPFKAGIFDAVDGTNDLLWGKVYEKTGVQHIQFDLNHRMTRLILNVEVERNETGEDTEEFTIDLSNAKVTLTQVLLNPISYRRLYGELLFQEKDGNTTVKPDISVPYQNIDLVIPPSAETGEYVIDDNGNAYTWAKTAVDEATGKKLYTTQDFVFVPQTLRQGTEVRPRIEIIVPAKDVNNGVNPGYEKQDYIKFSGNVPVTMQMDNNDGTPPLLQTLNFDPGKVITLTTKMKPGEMELEFAPVTVEPWVYKGTFYPTAKQSGIYTADDLYDLIEFYNAGNTFWLHKYGYIETVGGKDQWHFMINSGSLEFDAQKIVGTLNPGHATGGTNPEPADLRFDFRSRDEYYLMPDGTKVSMGTDSNALLQIVSATANKGVETPEDFLALEQAYQRNFWQQFIYGQYDNDAQQWIFKITDDITLNYGEIAATMLPRKAGVQCFRFVFDSGVNVTVNGRPGGAPSAVTPQDLYAIVSQRIPGIYSDQDFTNLLAAIRSGNTETMATYGSQTGGTWTFPLQRNITLSATAIQGAMRNVTTAYQFDLNGYAVTLNQYDNTVAKPTSDQLKTIMGLQKPQGIETEADFTALINAYNTTPTPEALSQYGYYCLPTPTWDFFFTDAMTLDRAAIQGSMIPGDDKPAFKFNLNFKQITFKDEPGAGITGDNGAKTLYEIVTTPASGSDPLPASRKKR